MDSVCAWSAVTMTRVSSKSSLLVKTDRMNKMNLITASWSPIDTHFSTCSVFWTASSMAAVSDRALCAHPRWCAWSINPPSTTNTKPLLFLFRIFNAFSVILDSDGIPLGPLSLSWSNFKWPLAKIPIKINQDERWLENIARKQN